MVLEYFKFYYEGIFYLKLKYTLSLKSLGSDFLKEINTFIQQRCIKLIKSDSKAIRIIIFHYIIELFQTKAVLWTLYS